MLAGVACRKASDKQLSTALTEHNRPVTGSTFANSTCFAAPDYGDTLIYARWKGLLQEHKIKPLNNPGAGTYFAIPQGMVINKYTGEVNVTRSEKGMRYWVGFVKSGTQDTCLSKLIIAGITYVDSIYVMAQNDTLAIPYYNANPLTPVICNNSDETDYPELGSHGDVKCEFDDDMDLDGFGLGDQPLLLTTLNSLLVPVRTISGVINLKKTLQGAFGLLPVNGMRLNLMLHYRLNDGSGGVLQKIPIQIIYYNRKSDIPPALSNDISTQRSSFYSTSTYNDPYASMYMKPRPPQIVITRYAD
jgi:hypothetical protein